MNVKPRDISVIVITKERRASLDRLMSSLSRMSQLPGEVIIISSSMNIEDERKLVKQYPLLTIRLIHEKKMGFSIARNRGIGEAAGKVVAFVDDDCTVPSDWIKAVAAAHSQIGDFGIVMGAVISEPQNNFFAQVAHMHYDNWVKTICRNGICTALDAKASSFDKRIFTQKGYWFDERYFRGSEDIEFGYRLWRGKQLIRYEPQIFFYHHERTRLIEVLKQRWRIATSEVVVAQQIADYDLVDMLPPAKIGKLIPRALKKLIFWLRTQKAVWCLQYIAVLPIFFLVRVTGYIWGNYQCTIHHKV